MLRDSPWNEYGKTWPMGNNQFDPKGVIPACLMPFDAHLEIDEPAYRRHLSDLASVDGVTATVSGHAAEVHALSFEEHRRGIKSARDEVAGKCRWWLAFTRETLVKRPVSPPRRRPERMHCWCFPQTCWPWEASSDQSALAPTSALSLKRPSCS